MLTKSPGYHTYTPEETLNFMLNRLSWDIDDARLRDIGNRVSSIENFVDVMLEEAEISEANGRLKEAGFLYRGAEFFMPPTHPRKAEAYDKFMDYFYRETPDAKALRTEVDFQGGKLGVIDMPAQGCEKGQEKDTILACSGFDGLIEEMYTACLPLTEAGYRVVLYEGTGQGSALRYHHIPMTYDWEVPTKAVLDHLNVESCTLLGLSLGGYLAPRAAAFEPRVSRLICWGAMHDFSGCFKKGMGEGRGELVYKLVGWGLSGLVNKFARKAMAQDAKAEWGLLHGMHTAGVETPFDFFRWTQKFTLDDVSPRIEQDVLIIMGDDDHLVPAEQLVQQAEAMTGAHSVTTRLVTDREHGAQHCQIGNPSLVINEILLWMEGLDRRDQSLAAAA